MLCDTKRLSLVSLHYPDWGFFHIHSRSIAVFPTGHTSILYSEDEHGSVQHGPTGTVPFEQCLWSNHDDRFLRCGSTCALPNTKREPLTSHHEARRDLMVSGLSELDIFASEIILQGFPLSCGSAVNLFHRSYFAEFSFFLPLNFIGRLQIPILKFGPRAWFSCRPLTLTVFWTGIFPSQYGASDRSSIVSPSCLPCLLHRTWRCGTLVMETYSHLCDKIFAKFLTRILRLLEDPTTFASCWLWYVLSQWSDRHPCHYILELITKAS